MQSELGQYVRRGRKQRGLTPQALALHIGYSAKGANKGARRIQQLELEGLEDPVFIVRVLHALGLDEEEARWLGQADEARRREAWERWADEPVRPMIVKRTGPYWWSQRVHELPPRYTSLVDCERYAGRVLRALNRARRRSEMISARLIWSRRLHVWFDAQGCVRRRDTVNYPSDIEMPRIKVGNKIVLLRLNSR